MLSRSEMYLKACCDRTGTDGLPEPISRIDYLLYTLAGKMATENGTVITDDPSKK